MNPRARDHAHAHAASRPVDLDGPAPGRTATSALLQGPVHPITSGLLQRKPRDGNRVAADADAAVSTAASSSGSSLPTALMRKFESSLGTDLSSVRVHTGTESTAAADAVGARAYTTGQDIHFGAGQYDPSSQAGEHLIAHEVAHTVQQRGGAPTRQHKLAVSAPHDAAEHEADRAADAMVSGGAFTVGAGSPMVSRAPAQNASGDAEVGKFTYALPSESIPERPWGQWVYVGAEGTPVVEVEATPEGNSTNPETKETGHLKVQPGKSVKYEAEAKRVYSENALVKVNESDKIGIDLKKQKIELGQGVSIETKTGPMPVELGATFLPFVWEKGKLKLLTGEISGKVTLL